MRTTTLFTVPFHLKGAWLGSSGPYPNIVVENAAQGNIKGNEAASVNLFRKECMHISTLGVTACKPNPSLGGDNRSRRLNTWGGAAWLLDLATTLHSFLNKFAKVASMSWVLQTERQVHIYLSII